MLLLFCIASPALAQNTKGDKPVRNQRQVRETKSKSVRKKSRGSTKDIAGRRLRTRNSSSANRANSSYTQSTPYRSKKTGRDRSAAPRGRTVTNSPRESKRRAWTGDISGHRIRTKKPSRNDAARSNVYPQNNAYVNNPSKKPKRKSPNVYTRTASGKPIVSRSPKQKQRAWKGNMQGGPIGSPSATGSVSNVYPQNGAYSRYATKSPRKSKTKTYSNSGVAGRLRTSSSGGRVVGGGYPRSASGPFVKRGRKNVYWGKFSKGERPFLTDLSGNPVRGRNFRSAAPGFAGISWLRQKRNRPGGDRAYRGQGGGFLSATARGQRAWIGDLAGRRIRSPKKGVTNETAGLFQFPRKMSISGNGKAGEFQFPRKMSISGNGKAGKKLPGGGYASRSNKRRDNSPLQPRAPGIGASGIAKGLSRTKGQRPMRGGGSVSGGGWNNKGMPISVRQPGAGGMRAGSFSGNIKGQRPLKGGGSVSGRTWNNRGNAIAGRQPGAGALRAGTFSGNIKGQRPLKGGGSVSGRTWNNKQTAIMGRQPSSSQLRAGTFSGNIKGQRPLKGGGSVSGRTWNNKQTAIMGRQPSSSQLRAGNFSGNIKGHRPFKGGGSVSGVMWNNKEKPIDVRPPSSNATRAGNFMGKINARRAYTQNPNAVEESTKKHRPSEEAYKVAGLQVKVKRGRYETKPKAAEEAMPGIGPKEGTVKAGKYGGNVKQGRYEKRPKAAEGSMLGIGPKEGTVKAGKYVGNIKQGRYEKKPKAAEEAMPGIGPKEGTVKASKYGGNVKLARNYKHNPKSHKDALDGIPPTSASVKASEYSSSMKQYWKYKHSPLGSDAALKVRAPNKAYARIGDYQGNIKMRKYNDHRLHPDAQFAHKKRGNVKEDRTIMMDVKLLWSKLFKKSETQPVSVKEKPLRPRYDKSEKGLWAGDPSYQKKKNEPKVKVE